MALSNYLPNSRINQSGVCTSSTRPVSPFEGQVIFETDTDRVLVWNNSAWVAPNSTTANPPGLELVKTQTVGSAVSSVTVTDAFSANYDIYLITYSGGMKSSDGALRLTIGNATSGYYGNIVYGYYSDSTPRSANDNNAAYFSSIAGGDQFNGAAATITVTNPFLTKQTYVSGGASYSVVNGFYQGRLANSVSYTYFTFSPASGTMTGGTIRVYGYRN